MKHYYIQPEIEAVVLQSMNVICGSPEISGGTESADPNQVDIF